MAVKEETKITRAVIAQIKELGGDGFHVHGSALQRGGEPDITGEIKLELVGWIHMKVEVKTPEGEPTERQLYRLRHYWEAGYLVGIVTSVSEFMKLLRNYQVWRVANQPAFPFTKYGNPYTEDIHRAKHNS